MIRVNQAGELGAVRIYQGQLAVLGKTPDGPVLKVVHSIAGRFRDRSIDRISFSYFRDSPLH